MAVSSGSDASVVRVGLSCTSVCVTAPYVGLLCHFVFFDVFWLYVIWVFSASFQEEQLHKMKAEKIRIALEKIKAAKIRKVICGICVLLILF